MFKKRYTKALPWLLLVLIFASPFFIWPRILTVSEINCQSQFGPCSQGLKEAIGSIAQEGKSLSETKSSLTSLLKNDILVNDFSFQFKLPSSLEVNLLERKPQFALKHENESILALVDEEGYVIALQKSLTLPRLIISEPLPGVGERISEKNLFALELLFDMFSFYQVRVGKLGNENLVIELPQGPRVIFPLDGDRKVLLGSLRLVLGKLNSEVQDSKIEDIAGVNTIDLRFKNPIIK